MTENSLPIPASDLVPTAVAAPVTQAPPVAEAAPTLPPTTEPPVAAPPTTTTAPAELLANIVYIGKPMLWMLVNHLNYAINNGTFNRLSLEEQFAVMQNTLSAKNTLGGWEPPKA